MVLDYKDMGNMVRYSTCNKNGNLLKSANVMQICNVDIVTSSV